jgi:hypothetical protein
MAEPSNGDEGLAKAQRIRVDVFHHFPDGAIEVDVSAPQVDEALAGLAAIVAAGIKVSISGSLDVEEEGPPEAPATHARITLSSSQGENMPGQITVDTTNETATLPRRVPTGTPSR